jgi:methylmalonyl-CoA/ethylmalonyl-CoA epimerase
MEFTLDHVGVVVRDRDSAVAEYRERFGYEVVGDETLPDLGVRLTYLQSGSGSLLQLVCPVMPGPLADHLAARDEGLHHLCFATPDIRAATAALAPGTDVRINRGGRNRLACFLPGTTAGVVIELTESEPSFGEGDGPA